jgi:hypothetical protein
MKYRLSNIVWDMTCDGEAASFTAEQLGLPSEMVVECDGDIAAEGADILSDKWGWCVISFDFEQV